MSLLLRYFPLAALLFILGGCATAPPKSLENICHIFTEKPNWHHEALKAKDRWGIPVHVPMAMMYQESSFRHDARPPKKYVFFGLIPWGRVSSAYGYSQALDGTWAQYKREAGNMLSSRTSFGDAIDFMGWYINHSQRQNAISKWDPYNQYLAYHEGWGGWKRKTYNRKPWLKNVAKTVESRSQRYSTQYSQCERNLTRGGWLW